MRLKYLRFQFQPNRFSFVTFAAVFRQDARKIRTNKKLTSKTRTCQQILIKLIKIMFEASENEENGKTVENASKKSHKMMTDK